MQALLIKCAIRSTLIAAAAGLVLLVMSIKAPSASRSLGRSDTGDVCAAGARRLGAESSAASSAPSVPECRASDPTRPCGAGPRPGRGPRCPTRRIAE